MPMTITMILTENQKMNSIDEAELVDVKDNDKSNALQENTPLTKKRRRRDVEDNDKESPPKKKKKTNTSDKRSCAKHR